MSKQKNTGLGRGLDAIFLDNASEPATDSVTMLRLSEIEPNPEQPRREFDPEALAQLADSIAANGLIQPIIVRSGKSDGYFEIVAGERRWRASKMAGLVEVPVIVMDLDDQRAAQVSLIENIQRENLNAIEEANAFKKLMGEYSMTQEELSKQIGKSRSLISNTMRLLDLPNEVIKMVSSDTLSAGHARTLLGLKNQDDIVKAAELTVARSLSVRALEALVRTMNKKAGKADAEDLDGELAEIEIDYVDVLAKKVQSRLGRRIAIKNTGKKHKIEIEYSDENDLEDIIKKLCGADIFDD